MEDNGLAGVLGLARKAGKLAMGEEEAISAVLERRSRLLLLAQDAGDGVVRRAGRAAESGEIVLYQLDLTKARLGAAVGRGACAAVAVTDVGLAALAARKLAAGASEEFRRCALELERRAEKTARRRREKYRRRKAAGKGKPWVPPPGGGTP